MKRNVIFANIADVAADALIYSTNVQLAFTGGVGAALMKRYGHQLQMDLVKEFNRSRKIQPKVGDVYVSELAYTPWSMIFHSIATDELCYTKVSTVSKILRYCLDCSIERQDISSVVCSPLGSGFGDLETIRFCEVVEEILNEYENSSIEVFSVVCNDKFQFKELTSIFSGVDYKDWEKAVQEEPSHF